MANPLPPANAALSEQIYQYVLSEIIRVQLEPGAHINITKIAADLGVSRTPIRSAMEQLVADGLILQESDRGYTVAPVSLADCFNLCDARKMLEGTAAQMAANHIRPADLDILGQSVSDAQACLDRQEYDRFADYDALFHETLLRAAGNHYLMSVYDTIKIRIDRYRHIISTYCRNTAEQDTRYALAKHRCIYLAVKNRYSSVARNEMEEHIAFTYRTVFNLSTILGGPDPS